MAVVADESEPALVRTGRLPLRGVRASTGAGQRG